MHPWSVPIRGISAELSAFFFPSSHGSKHSHGKLWEKSFPWDFRESHALPWYSVGYCGKLWETLGDVGILWESLGISGKKNSHGNLWEKNPHGKKIPMGNSGKKTPMGIFLLWESLGDCGTVWEYLIPWDYWESQTFPEYSRVPMGAPRDDGAHQQTSICHPVVIE
jgi:hypothetical protein